MARPSPSALFLVRELTRAARRRGTWLARMAVTAGLLGLLAFWFAQVSFRGQVSPEGQQILGQGIAAWSGTLAWLFLALALPLSIASAVQEESERGRGDLLTLAGVPPSAVRIGAASARSMTSVLVLLALLPAVALAASFGGVDPFNDGLTIGLLLVCLTVEVALLSAWLASEAKGPMPVAVLVWLWLWGVSVAAPLLLDGTRLPSNVCALLNGPAWVLTLYSAHWANLGPGAGWGLPILVVHGPIIGVIALGLRHGPLRMLFPALLYGLIWAIYFVPVGAPAIWALGAWAAAGSALFFAPSVLILRWWSSRGAAKASARIAPGAAHRWTDHIWDDPVAWRETATNAYGVVNRIIGRAYIGAGVIALLTLVLALARGSDLSRIYYAMGVLGLGTAVVVTMLASTASILEERRSDALELLLLSGMGPAGVLRGKLRAALVLAGPGACLAILGLPAYLGGAGQRALRNWDGIDLLWLPVTYLLWVPALLIGLGGLMRALSLGARTVTAAWMRVAGVTTVTVLLPWLIQQGRRRSYSREVRRFFDLGELLLPFRADAPMLARCVSAGLWFAVAVITIRIVRRRLDRGDWPRGA